MRRRDVRIIREPYVSPNRVPENLRYTLDVFDDGESLVAVHGRLAELSVAQSAFREAVAKYPSKRIFLRERARVIKRFDELA
jgi:hypothetical protein